MPIGAGIIPTRLIGDWWLPYWGGTGQTVRCAAAGAAARRSRGTTIFARMMRPRGTVGVGWTGGGADGPRGGGGRSREEEQGNDDFRAHDAASWDGVAGLTGGGARAS